MHKALGGSKKHMDYAKKTYGPVKEETEQVEEGLIGGQKKLDKNHNGKLDSQDFKILRGKKKMQENHEYEDGDMSITQLKQIKAHADWILEMLKPETDMPEWVQAKITIAADYLSTACDYLHVEMNEDTQYPGLEKEDKPGKVKTAVVKLHPKGVESETVEGWKDTKKPTKESFDDEGFLTPTKISYSDFAMMLEGRAQYTVKLHHPEKGHTIFKTYAVEKGEDEHDVKRRAQSEPSHSGYEIHSVRKKDTDTYEADDENDNVGTKAPGKRGPKVGSKRGPRTNLGSSKLHNK